MTLTLIFIILASAMSAVMDTLTHHYDVSVFSHLNRQFWDPQISWYNKYENARELAGRKIWFRVLHLPVLVPVQVTDAWHLAKTLMIIFICAAVVSYAPGTQFFHRTLYNQLIDFTLIGIAWNVTFSLLYGRVFRKK